MTPVYERNKYLTDMPTTYCPGCMHATATRIIAEVVDELGVKDNAIYVLPVGCSTQGITAWDMDIIGAAHGRAPAARRLRRRPPSSGRGWSFQCR